MISTFKYLSNYNLSVNQDLFALLKALPPEELSQEIGSYYHSILGLLNHILVSDYAWLQRFAGGGLCATPSLPEVEEAFADDLPYESLEAWYEARQKLDALYLQINDKLTPELWEEDFEYRKSSGETVHQPLGLLFLHLFNHMTHHRGQISQILDAKGIPHDFSGLRQRYL